MPTFTASQLKRITQEIFFTSGFPMEEATIIANLIVSANLAGHDSHGVIHIPKYMERIRKGYIRPGAPVEVEHETPTTAVLNGNFTLGHVAATKAMQVAIAKAKQYALAAVGVHNLNHIGRLGAYAMMATEVGMGAIVTTCSGGASRMVTPFWARQGRLSTNPIAMCFPNPAGAPLLLDMATSVAADGKIKLAMNRGELIGEGWILDQEGHPSRDPGDFFDGGMLLPLGGKQGHKGYCLAVMVEILSGILARTGTAAKRPPDLNNGTFMIVIDLKAFVSPDQYGAEVTELVDYLHATLPEEGRESVWVPGEYEARNEAKRAREGIFVDDETWRQIETIVKELGITAYLAKPFGHG
jgi:LDH2 family malate/lactate/ureidoglycolate dehydrogenase